MSMTAKDIVALLAADAEGVCAYLLPNGKRKGHHWECGSTNGEEGQSLKVLLSGERRGRWADFQTDDERGDMLDLWCAVRRVDLSQAIREARSYLGLPEMHFQPKRKEYARPERPKCFRPKENSPIIDYLTGRGIDLETIESFRIAEKDRFMVFPFIRNGELLNVKHLGIDRDENGGRKMWMSKDAEPCLFGWHLVPADIRSIAITEGEIDCMTLYQLGIKALSVPNGANGMTWVELEYPNLERFDQIFLCLDNDDAGKKATAHLVERLGQHRCRVVTFGGHKDANDALKAGWKLNDFAKAMMESRTVDPAELKHAVDYADDVIDLMFPADGVKPGTSNPWKKIGDNFKFRKGETTLWTGINGHGKSTALAHAMTDAIAQGEKVCIASMEQHPAATLEIMTYQATGLGEPSEAYARQAIEWLGGKNGGGLWLFNVVGTAKAERLIEVMRYARQRYEVSHFVVDSLAKCGFDDEDYSGQKKFVDQLFEFGRTTGAHVHLVAHSRKGKDESDPPGKMDVKGSGGITDMVDNVVAIWKNKNKFDQIDKAEASGEYVPDDLAAKPDAMLIVHKQRKTGWEKKINLWFSKGSRQFLDHADSKSRNYAPFDQQLAEQRMNQRSAA